MVKKHSIWMLWHRVIHILTPTQKRALLKSCGAGFINAALEWMSLAAVIPLFYQLIEGTPSPQHFPAIMAHFSNPMSLFTIVGIFLMKAWLSHSLAKKQLSVTNNIYLDLSERVYKNYFNQDYVSYASTSHAEAFRKIKNTAFDFANHVVHGFLTLFTDAMICVITTLLIIWIDYRVVIAMIVLGTPTLIFYHLLKKHWMKKIDESFRMLTPQANIVLSQGIESYAEARVYHSQAFFISAFLNISHTTSYLLGNLKVLSTLPARIMEVVGVVCFMLIVFFGTKVTSSTELLLLFGLLSLAIYRIMPAFNRIMASITQIQSYAYAVDEIYEDGQTTADVETGNHTPLSFTHTIHLDQISFSYQRLHPTLFNNLNVTIAKGDFVLLNGPSGSGKTTLIHMLAGLIQPTQGTIKIDGHELNTDVIASWQNVLGYVPQAAVIHNDSILNNIRFTKNESVNQESLRLAMDVTGLNDLIANLPEGMETRVGESGLSLSGGQRQRLMLARALYRNPGVLLLDEATNQLDHKSKIEILTRLRSLTEKGTTVILSSHDAAVRPFATKEIYLDRNSVTSSVLR